MNEIFFNKKQMNEGFSNGLINGEIINDKFLIVNIHLSMVLVFYFIFQPGPHNNGDEDLRVVAFFYLLLIIII